jgi:hypothetical protein
MGKRELRNTRIRKIMVLTADGRRWTQTFSSADLAEENRLALRAGDDDPCQAKCRGTANGF